MAVIETWLHQDLQEPVKVNHLDGNLFSNNGNGNRIGVVLTNNGEALASISGTVSGYVVTADGSTVPCTGSKSGNRASILIPAAAYQPGSIFITVFVTDGTTVTTIGAVSTTVMRSRTNTQVDPGSAVTDWTQTINAAMQSVETAAENLGGIVAVPYASITFPVPLGKYTYYNNNLYRCITPIVSSESFTAAHWTQVRLGDEVSDLKSAFITYQDGEILYNDFDIIQNSYPKADGSFDYFAGWDRTDYIPIEGNQVVCVNNISQTTDNAWYDENKTIISRFTIGVGSPEVISAPETARYMVISNLRNKFFSKIYTIQAYYAENDAVKVGFEKLANSGLSFIDKLAFARGYWNASGVLTDSATTFHTKKMSITSGHRYYVLFPASTTKIVIRNFDSLGGIDHTDEITSSGEFTATTETIAFNALGTATTDDIYLFDAQISLALKSDTLISNGIISTGTIALSDYVDNGWYFVYAAVTVTDRPSGFPSGGFMLVVQKTNSVVYQFVYPFDYSTWAFRIIGKSWNQPQAVRKQYVGKTISIIGDSLSDKSNSTAEVRYYDVVDEQLGTTSTEYAMSGCGYKRKYNNGDAFYEQAAKIETDTDLVLIFGSFNDHNVYDTDGLGNVTDTTTDTVFGCVNYTLETIFTRAPKAAVGIILPTPWSQYPPYDMNTLQWDYVNGIIEIAKRKSVPVLNLYTESNMRPWDSTFRVNFYKEGEVQDSGTHPSSAGHKRFAPKVVEFVKSILEQASE